MTGEEVIRLAREGYRSFPEDVPAAGQAPPRRPLRGKMEETHISWVILSGKYAFKIKKPLSQSFLDFSTLERRKACCERELQLNRRFSNIYLSIMPVRQSGNSFYIGEGPDGVVDYAVQMKRMASSRRMDKLLRKRQVGTAQIQSLATLIAAFHHQAEVVRRRFDLDRERTVFNDIRQVLPEVERHLGENRASLIRQTLDWSDAFLDEHAARFQERIDEGMRRDLHGDLHSGNIFLYERPVLFDCIEFDERYRQIDVLKEIAFLCMDLDASGQPRLGETFLESYLEAFPCMKEGDEKLFLYYKCCYANVRAKVNALRLKEGNPAAKGKSQRLRTIRTYLELMADYKSAIQEKTEHKTKENANRSQR